jgi:hypothetical protein
MLADITITIPTSAIHAAAWFVIGAASVAVALIVADLRASNKRNADVDSDTGYDWLSN